MLIRLLGVLLLVCCLTQGVFLQSSSEGQVLNIYENGDSSSIIELSSQDGLIYFQEGICYKIVCGADGNEY
ncbi:MAG: hypothetical protein HY606_09170 [Planctomycetes bacterium]|nr:hypothetical protein [Planctomycetota bacterium]